MLLEIDATREVGPGRSAGGASHARLFSGTAESVVDLDRFLPACHTGAIAPAIIGDRKPIAGTAYGPGRITPCVLRLRPPRPALDLGDTLPSNGETLTIVATVKGGADERVADLVFRATAPGGGTVKVARKGGVRLRADDVVTRVAFRRTFGPADQRGE